MVVVAVDTAMQALLELLDARQLVGVEELAFERAEEAFHGRIVQTVALAGHALGQSAGNPLAPLGWHLVLPALVGVQQWRLLT